MPNPQWIAILAAFLPALAWAQPFYHSAYITDQPHTQITFETDGDGHKVNLLQGQSLSFPANEYESQGFSFSRSIKWVNDGGADFDEAQAIGGSPPIAIPGVGLNDFYITFSATIRSFGFWIIQHTSADDPVTFQIWSDSSLIDTITFTGLAIDGQIGVAQYGFLGYTVGLNKNIRYIFITKDAAILDNFTFSPMPVALPDPDIDNSGQVNVGDLVLFVEQWLDNDCGRCSNADLNTDGNITLLDLTPLADNWLQ